MKVSIIIINYNYAEFLNDSIGNSLSQSYNNIEVIVVDDGSTDDSQKVIDGYGDSVKKIYQPNKGMMEAANAGFALSTGDIIIFLDADDFLYSNAVSKIIQCWRQEISLVHFRLQKIDDKGEKIGFVPPLSKKLSEGEVWKEIVNKGSYVSTPMSGNAFSKFVLDKIFPVKDARIGESGSYFDRIPTDAYLKFRIPFFGPVIAIQDALGVYRIHGKNAGARTNIYSNQRKRNRYLTLAKMNSEFINKQLANKGLESHNEFFFRNNKFMVLRILSFRFDGQAHLWKNDTRLSLILKAIGNLFRSQQYNIIRRVYNLTINILLTISPEKFAMELLRVIHAKSFRNS